MSNSETTTEPVNRPFLALVSKLVIGDQPMPVRFLYRTVQADLRDTGWRMYSGYEDEAFLADKQNMTPYPVETLLQMDESLRPLLDSRPGAVWERVPGSTWQEVDDYVIPTEGDEVSERIQTVQLNQLS